MENEEDLDKKKQEKRTSQQNRALHLFFEQVAKGLNDAGLDMRATLGRCPNIQVPWTKNNVKDFLWRPFQNAMLKKTSTAKLNTKEVGEVYKVFDQHFGETFGFHQSFPSDEEVMLQQEIERRARNKIK